jgi:hypothetical protein
MYPEGVAVSSTGAIYVADAGNNRVQKFIFHDIPLPTRNTPVVTTSVPNYSGYAGPNPYIFGQKTPQKVTPILQPNRPLDLDNEQSNSTPVKVDAPVGNMGGTVFTRNLVVGYKGQDVYELQVYLNKNGYTLATSGPGSPGEETNTFGPLTRKALIKFQGAKKIQQTGNLGPLTRAAINNANRNR